MTALCKSLCYIAAKKREEEASDFNIDFDTQSKSAFNKPVALQALGCLPGACKQVNIQYSDHLTANVIEIKKV
jgi:hypothetical protein